MPVDRHGLNGVHPLASNAHGREKRTTKIGGNGRGNGRGGADYLTGLPPVQVTVRPPSHPALVGARVTGAFVCPACRTHTATLVHQLPGSTHHWVCADWCSPRDPRRQPFTSTIHTQESTR